jgi:hypothetical protein
MATDYRATTLRPYFDLLAKTCRAIACGFSYLGLAGLFFRLGFACLGLPNQTATLKGGR